MTTARRVVSAVWPLALLAVFVATFREPRNAKTATTAKNISLGGLGDLCVQESGDLERCVADDPTDVAVLTDLGDSHQTNGRADLAEAAYRRALSVDPRDGDLHVRLGELLLKRGDRQGAHAEAESALRWHPASARALNLAARSGSPAVPVNDP